MQGDHISHVSPQDAWDALKTANGSALLIDVRTPSEWSFVGVPDLDTIGQQTEFIEWPGVPSMEMLTRFAENVLSVREQSGATVIYFICRSGVRSHHAAMTLAAPCAEHGTECINVAEGFEGNNGALSGWKARGLPWHRN